MTWAENANAVSAWSVLSRCLAQISSPTCNRNILVSHSVLLGWKPVGKVLPEDTLPKQVPVYLTITHLYWMFHFRSMRFVSEAKDLKRCQLYLLCSLRYGKGGMAVGLPLYSKRQWTTQEGDGSVSAFLTLSTVPPQVLVIIET